MGWASGSDVADGVWKAVGPHIPADQVENVARQLVEVFEAHDCDTMQECAEPLRNAANRMSRERDGAPRYPVLDEMWSDTRFPGEAWRFDGKQWVNVDEEDEEP